MFHLRLWTSLLAMGTYRPNSGAKNFVALSAKARQGTAQESTGVVLALDQSSATQSVTAGDAAYMDRSPADVPAEGKAKAGCVLLLLTASTPVTVNLLNLLAQSITAGDAAFGTVYSVRFYNTGTTDVTVTPGASNAFNGPLSGTTPGFTVYAGGTPRWNNPAGWAVNSSARNLTFDPGSSAASISVIFVGDGF